MDLEQRQRLQKEYDEIRVALGLERAKRFQARKEAELGEKIFAPVVPTTPKYLK